jgi:hypothetical protein
MGFCRMITVLSFVLVAGGRAWAWENMLQDPGFEGYQLTPKGYYALDKDSAWREITLGKCSVQFNAGTWKAPADMLRERPLGFSPGTTGFDGMGPEQNKGRLIIDQDVVKPGLFTDQEQYYEAWIWLAGAGNDDDNGPDRKEEMGGWEILFFDNTDTSTWKDNKAIEHHGVNKDFFGERNTFVQVSGFGKIPARTKGVRMRVHATTWASASQPAKYRTEVAIDNAHFAVLGSPNMLVNGNFEMDVREGELKGWTQPAAWPFPRNGMKPRKIINAYGENFDHGTYRPFYGGKWAYGYATYLDGWTRDAFTFGQTVKYDLPAGTPLTLMFNWIENIAEGGKADQVRVVGCYVDLAVEYLKGNERLGAEGFRVDWPVPKGPACVGRYDQNADGAYNPRFYLQPPKGTERIGVYVSHFVNMPYRDGFAHICSAIDDFWLGPVEKPQP